MRNLGSPKQEPHLRNFGKGVQEKFGLRVRIPAEQFVVFLERLWTKFSSLGQYFACFGELKRRRVIPPSSIPLTRNSKPANSEPSGTEQAMNTNFILEFFLL
jgi:hypothetical protein